LWCKRRPKKFCNHPDPNEHITFIVTDETDESVTAIQGYPRATMGERSSKPTVPLRNAPAMTSERGGQEAGETSWSVLIFSNFYNVCTNTHGLQSK
jgi:hypothetical protein